MKKFNEMTHGDLYNQDICMDILLGLYDEDIKKAKKSNKKAGKVIAFKKPNKLPKPVAKKPVAPVIEEKVVVSIEEQKPMAPVVEEPVIDMSTTLIDDKDQAIEVIMNQLDNKATDLSENDFVPEVWAEAWTIANERYFSMAEDYQETIMPSGERIMRMPPNRLAEFMEDRAQTIASWDTEDTVNDEYIYEDDEVNPEKCDATILSFDKAFDCMKAEEPAPKSKLDTLLDIIIDNQEEFHDRYNRHNADDESYKPCPNCYDLSSKGIDSDDLTDKTLARALYMDIRHDCALIADKFLYHYRGERLFAKDDLLDILMYMYANYNTSVYYMDFTGIRDDLYYKQQEYKEAV